MCVSVSMMIVAFSLMRRHLQSAEHVEKPRLRGWRCVIKPLISVWNHSKSRAALTQRGQSFPTNVVSDALVTKVNKQDR